MINRKALSISTIVAAAALLAACEAQQSGGAASASATSSAQPKASSRASASGQAATAPAAASATPDAKGAAIDITTVEGKSFKFEPEVSLAILGGSRITIYLVSSCPALTCEAVANRSVKALVQNECPKYQMVELGFNDSTKQGEPIRLQVPPGEYKMNQQGLTATIAYDQHNAGEGTFAPGSEKPFVTVTKSTDDLWEGTIDIVDINMSNAKIAGPFSAKRCKTYREDEIK